MESLKTKILQTIGIAIVLFFIVLSYNHNQLFLDKIVLCSLIIGGLLVMKARISIKNTDSSRAEIMNAKTTENDFSKSYKKQYF